MNDNDLLPVLNEMLVTNYKHTGEFSIEQLTRACLIAQLNQLLDKNPDTQIFECRPTDAPQPEQTLFVDLDDNALFEVPKGDLGTFKKLPMDAQRPTNCIFGNCSAGRARYNVKGPRSTLAHVCPSTPVVEVPF